ncbi:uncharacterized protein LOC128733859 [Sabethes cyaneus]|uniref:uncharacterized protein LOC128733859 n=1 Tax=Sabethes cyaneus TaxID=53552 RepID=UPI00237EBB92|nr:uncharacterized protein LOC128733859 [Sabethes cyaneus]
MAIEINTQCPCVLYGAVTFACPTDLQYKCTLQTPYGTYKGRTKVFMFTDASKEGHSCGIGIYVEGINKSITYHLANEVSITEAELIAIKVALYTIAESNLQEAVIYTDSRAACEILKLAKEQDEREEIVDEILETADKWNISLQWIPSHIGVIGNDIADKLAKRGTIDGQILENKISYKDAYWILKSRKTLKTNTWYNDYAKEKGQTFFQLQPEIKAKPWFIGLTLNGQQVRLLNRLMAGHDWSKYWKHKMKITENPNCEICEESETAEHLILHCTKFNNIRIKYSFIKYKKLIDVFKTKNTSLYKEITDFVKETGLEI